MAFYQEFPGGSKSNDTLRIQIIAKEIKKQNLDPKDPNHIEVGGIMGMWNFIAPTDIQESITHTWEEYHSFQGRAAQLRSDTVTSVGKASQILDGPARRAGSTNPAKLKVDSPVVYTGSERLEYSFTFLLMHYTDIKNDVMTPIHELRKLGCAVIAGQAIDTIQFPAIFEITSQPAPFIHIPVAALTNVQTTYNAPYKGGLPSRAELTLTFKDVQPLYQGSWGDIGGMVTTGVI